MKTSHRALLRPILLTVAAAIGLAGFLPAPAAEAATATYRIAVLGDSWAAGEGVTPFYSGEGDGETGCHRSQNAWFHDVKLPNGQTVRQASASGTASVQFLACTGAWTANITDFSRNGEGPQLGRMSSSTTHVFVSISGNDIDFASILTKCANVSAAECQTVADKARASSIPGAMASLKQTLQKVHAKVPTAEIILTGYASPVSSDSWPFKYSAAVVKTLANDFNQQQVNVVDVLAKTMNIKFADIRSPFAGHEDGQTEPWFFGIIENGWPWRKLHPNDLGQPAIAKVVSPKVLKPFSCPTLVQSGATGECVKQIQRSLNAWGYSTQLTVDGDFGAATKAAVITFQGKKGLTKDGIVGSATKAILFDK